MLVRFFYFFVCVHVCVCVCGILKWWKESSKNVKINKNEAFWAQLLEQVNVWL